MAATRGHTPLSSKRSCFGTQTCCLCGAQVLNLYSRLFLVRFRCGRILLRAFALNSRTEILRARWFFRANARMLWQIFHRIGFLDRQIRRRRRLWQGSRFHCRFVRCVARHLQRCRHVVIDGQCISLRLSLRVERSHIGVRDAVNHLRFCSRRRRRLLQFSLRLRRNGRRLGHGCRRQRANRHRRSEKESDEIEMESFHAMPPWGATASRQKIGAGTLDGWSFINKSCERVPAVAYRSPPRREYGVRSWRWRRRPR